MRKKLSFAESLYIFKSEYKIESLTKEEIKIRNKKKKNTEFRKS